MNAYYDALETRDPEARERDQMSRLAQQVAYAKQHSPAMARALRDVEPADIASRAALAKVPVLRKSDLVDLQKRERPFGGLAARSTATWRSTISAAAL